MILSVHILTGAAIFSKIAKTKKLWLIGILAAFLSHFVLDALPQWQYFITHIEHNSWTSSYADFLKIAIDLIIGFLIVWLLAKNPKTALVGGFFGALPDCLQFIHLLFPTILNNYSDFHNQIQFLQRHTSPIFGLAIEILVVILSIILLEKRSARIKS